MIKRNWTTILLIISLLIGLSLLLYPSFSNYWNSQRQTKAIANYTDFVANLKEEDYSVFWESAYDYNESLVPRSNQYLLTEEQESRYDQELNVTGNGIMGFIDIPSINVSLPIYHGTDDDVLQVAVGHIEWSSLPAGGESTHCVVSGHRGLPSAKLFTDLDKLAVGDYFMMNVLDQVLTYQVDQVRIVEPHETEDLLIQEGKDLCTLVTCTPYGINSHRMLVRGHRVDNLEEAQIVRVTADAMIIEKMVVAPFVLAPILLVMLIFLLVGTRKKRNRRNEK